MQNKLKNLNKKNKGFVSLFAVLISLIIVAITFGISNVAFKENVLASSAKEGSYAFFAADTGLECALYHDSESKFQNSPTSFSCVGQNLIVSSGVNGDFNFSFEIEMSDRQRCVEVAVFKNYPANDPIDPSLTQTRVYSNGYNVGCADVGGNNNRIVNRLLVAIYPNPPTTP